MTRAGYVAEAAVDVLAARLSVEVPGLGQAEIRRIALAQAVDLRRSGWKVIAPVEALAASLRRLKTRT
jgi:hypothetical protein